jgi:hypothetical protein
MAKLIFAAPAINLILNRPAATPLTPQGRTGTLFGASTIFFQESLAWRWTDAPILILLEYYILCTMIY